MNSWTTLRRPVLRLRLARRALALGLVQLPARRNAPITFPAGW